jgi:hypothetical protein
MSASSRICAPRRSWFADETTAPVLDPGRGRTKTGQLWTYAKDDRPWGGSDPPAVGYVYAPDRKASQPIAHKGVLQVDGYAGYRALAEEGDVSLAFWRSSVRRRFYELFAADASRRLVPIKGEFLGVDSAGRPRRDDKSYYGDNSIKNHGRLTS